MALSARQLLNRRFSKAFEELAQGQSDLLEQSKVSTMPGVGMESGFGAEERARINYELGQDRKDLLEAQAIETEILDTQEKQAKEAEAKAKKQRIFSTIGGIASAIPGLGAVGAGIGLAAQAASGLYGGAADFSNIDYSALGKMGGYFKKKKYKYQDEDLYSTPPLPVENI